MPDPTDYEAGVRDERARVVAMDQIREAVFQAMARHVDYLKAPLAGTPDDCNRLIDDIALTVALAIFGGEHEEARDGGE